MRYRKWVEKYIKYSGLKIEIGEFIKVAYTLPLIFISAGILVYLFFGYIPCLVILAVLLLLEFILHITLVSISSKRALISEERLPDALRLISSNLRVGIIPERAFIESARPEFGPLSEQIKEAGKSLMLGKPIKEAFKLIPEKINSNILRKIIDLISESTGKGGNLAPLLDGLADDIKSSLMLKKDIQAQVASYSMFIFLAIGLGAPLLYSSSLFLTETLIGLGEILPEEGLEATGVSMNLSNISLSKEFLFYYSILLMVISAIFGGILVGLIKDGKELDGLKYIPVLIFMDLGIFYVLKFVLLASFAVF